MSLSGKPFCRAPDDDFGSKTDAGSVTSTCATVPYGRARRASIRAANGDRVGSAVSLFSKRHVRFRRARNRVNANQGRVWSTSAPTTWTLGGSLTASDGAAQDRFGASVTVSGPFAVIGAPFANSLAGVDSGKSYLFANAGAGFAEINTLVATDNAAGDQFGKAAAFDAGRAIVGAPLADSTGVDAGAGYVFQIVTSTATTITGMVPATTVSGQSYDVSVQ